MKEFFMCLLAALLGLLFAALVTSAPAPFYDFHKDVGVRPGSYSISYNQNVAGKIIFFKDGTYGQEVTYDYFNQGLDWGCGITCWPYSYTWEETSGGTWFWNQKTRTLTLYQERVNDYKSIVTKTFTFPKGSLVCESWVDVSLQKE